MFPRHSHLSISLLPIHEYEFLLCLHSPTKCRPKICSLFIRAHYDPLPLSQHSSKSPYPQPDQSNLRLPTDFITIYLNTVLPSMPMSCTLCLSFSLLPHTCHMICPAHLPQFDHRNFVILRWKYF